MATLKAIPQNQFQNCFEGRLGADIGAQLPKGSTLKASTVVFSSEVCCTFTAMSSQTQLSDHVLFNPLNAELNPICRLLALLGTHHILHVSR